VERLLAQLQYSFSQLTDLEEEDRRKQDELDIKCLQIMRAIIHNEIVNIDPELKENSPPGYRKRCVSKVQPIQNSIQDLDNAVSRIVPLLSHSNDEIVREVLAFLKAMLYSGNSHVQEGMNTVFDTREERLFTTMASLLKNSAFTFNERWVEVWIYHNAVHV
jgi:inositol 1,4,5-triphosphate receptor type 1